MAFLAASSAASWAAKGVLFLEPLNPLLPALHQARVFPPVSVIVMIVLLKVAWICATPTGTFFLTFLADPFFGLAILPSSGQVLFPFPATDRWAVALSGPGIGFGALASDRQTSPVPQSFIRPQIHLSLNVESHFTAKVTFDHVAFIYNFPETNNLTLIEINDPDVRINIGLPDNSGSFGRPNPVNIRDGDLNSFTSR